MSFVSSIRQLRRSIGLGPPAVADYLVPAIGILALGMLAGAGVALLFAPTSGKKLREEVERKLTDFRSRLMLQEGDGKGLRRNNAQQVEAYPRS